MELRGSDGVRAEVTGAETGWDARMGDAPDELRMDAGTGLSATAGVYPGDDPDFRTRADGRALADQYSVGPQERP
jgi:hypothetical protein